MTIDPSINVIKQYYWGVMIHNYHDGKVHTDIKFFFTPIARAVGDVIGITHLIDFEQSNEIKD